MDLYDFVGDPNLRTTSYETAHFLINTEATLRAWMNLQDDAIEYIATFVVDAQSRLYIADRRTEHIACARGGRVQAAGELTFALTSNKAHVIDATNQSTGFCPRVESWQALHQALSAANIEHPAHWTRAFEFRRCQACGELNLVKDDWFVCTTCDTELPLTWNCVGC